MKTFIKIVLSLITLCFFFSVTAQETKTHKTPTPPMGWNSYNSFGAAVYEEDVKANVDYMAKYMKDLGWEYIVVDYCWYYPHPPGSIQDNPPQFRLPKDGALVPWFPMDEYGRLYPDPGKFPSAAGGKGFKPLADYVHGKGLKFGIHIMRGIPRQAQWAKSNIKDAPGITADKIADTTSVCPWLNSMYGVDMTKEGSQAYYNSLIELYESWGVDYIKVDDIDLKENYPYRKLEVEALRKAIDYHKSDIVLSLSLNMKFENRDHVSANSELWRISMDFWDNWDKLKHQFELINQWNSVTNPDSWPDADMLQIGKIAKRGPNLPERFSYFTEDEMLTHITLWMIARSPLMMGGHMPENTPFVKKLLTTLEVIEVNQKGKNQKQLWQKDGLVAWVSDAPDGKSKYLAIFNLNETAKNITVKWSDIQIQKTVSVRNLWTGENLGKMKFGITRKINPHGAQLFKISK